MVKKLIANQSHTMIKIYHNNRCSKSRCAIIFLEEKGTEFEVVKYLETNPSEKELKELLKILNLSPIDLVRKGEAIWKENYKHKTLTDAEIITAMAENPKLIERPIISNGKKAVIGRPTERILEVL